MKMFTTIILFLFSALLLLSCNTDDYNGYQEQQVMELCGTWEIEMSTGVQGTVTFTKDCGIILSTINGYGEGDYSFCVDENGNELKNSIAITYLTDENGNELLTEEDEENGGIICTFTILGHNTIYANGFPFYREELLLLIKQ